MQEQVNALGVQFAKKVEKVDQRSRRPAARRDAPYRWTGCDGLRQLAEDLREQSAVEVHANGLTHVGRDGAMQAERYSGFVEMGIEPRRSLECSDIELLRIF